MDDKDLQIENILADRKKKKTTKDKPKVDGKAKGNRTEVGLCKLFTDHFGTDFTKAPGSGALSTVRGLRLPEHAKKTLTGDLCVPEKFKWVIECKGGYEKDVDIPNALDGNGNPCLDSFIEQTSRDSDYCGRKPIVCWKRNRKPWLAMLKLNEIEPLFNLKDDFPYRLYYRDWVMISLEKLLAITGKGFWFDE